MRLPPRARRATALALLPLLLVAGCATREKAPPAPASGAAVPPGVKLGRPYQVFGQTYVPVDDRAYDETGIASWYGPGFHAGPTANGETYDQDALTAAHRTLPLPSWVEVTNLQNGRSLVVRINDRGPFVDGRIIDLSRAAARQLGIDGPGTARVRVVRVFPEGDWARATPPLGGAPVRLAAAAPAPVTTVAASPIVAAPVEAVAGFAVPVSSSGAAMAPAPGTIFVQVAAVGDPGRAQFLASDLADLGPGQTSQAPNGLWRVRLGPYANEAEAAAVQRALAARGFPGARLVRTTA
jgi:rare lipoprotein A